MRSGQAEGLGATVTRLNQRLYDLPDIFPALGPLTRAVLFADFECRPPRATPNQWLAEYPVLVDHGLAGVALRLARTYSLDPPPDVARRLEDARFDEITSTFRMLERTRTGLAAMKSAAIPFVVIKGPGIAQVSRPSSERNFSDIDVLVPPAHFSRTLHLLEGLGYVERPENVQPWRSHRRLGREATNLRTADGGSIDLHHRISPWNWACRLNFDQLMSRTTEHPLAGLSTPIISTEDNLLVAAFHVVSDKSQPGKSYRVWRDLLVLTRASSPEVVVDLAARSGTCGWLHWILACLPEPVQPGDLMAQLESHARRIPRAMRLQLLLRTEREHLLNPMYRIPAGNALFTIFGSLVPSRRYLQLEYPHTSHGYLTRWHNLLSRVPIALSRTHNLNGLVLDRALSRSSGHSREA